MGGGGGDVAVVAVTRVAAVVAVAAVAVAAVVVVVVDDDGGGACAVILVCVVCDAVALTREMAAATFLSIVARCVAALSVLAKGNSSSRTATRAWIHASFFQISW